jgi:hypothetical protein
MNPVPVNSDNIVNFGFGATFKLASKQILFVIDGYTSFKPSGTIQGIFFKVVDPSGITIKDIDFNSPDITLAGHTKTVSIPNNLFMFGWWQITATLKDQDGTLTTVEVKKNICEAAAIQNGTIPGQLTADINCDSPSIKITETTNLSYNGKSPVIVSKSGNFYYPQGTLDSQAFTVTPFLISGSDSVYTGDYIVKNTTTATYDLQDGIFLELQYITKLNFSVNCNTGLASVICCIEAVTDIYQQWPNTERGKSAKAQLDIISPYVYLALSKEKIGLSSSEEILKIADILGCDCNCGAQLISPRTVDATQTIVVAAGCGIDVDVVTEGSNTTYTISGATTAVTNDNDDLAFNVILTQSGCQNIYAISLNYGVLAENILVAIDEDDNLKSLFNAIVDKTLFQDALNSFDGKCIIDLSSADYILAVPINESGVQTITAIFIDGASVAAPDGLSLLNPSGISTWLNSLSKGTFTVNEDDTAGTVTIQSLANTFKVSTLTVSTVVSGNTSTKTYLFSTNTKSLVDLLQLLFDYVCALDTTEIAFGVAGLQQYSFNSDYSAVNKITIDQAAKLSDVLKNMILAQQQLFTRLNAAGLSCVNINSLFGTVDKMLVSTDGILGTKGGSCAKVSYDELASIILTKITASSDLASQLCGISQGCAGAVCAPVTNVSGVFASGTLTVDANDTGDGSTVIQVRYRIANSGLTFTQVNTTAGALPIAIGSGGLTNAQYEVQVRKLCSNGVYSPWVSGASPNGCVVPLSVNIGLNGANFGVQVALSGSQTIVEVLMTDPTGGQTTVINDFGAPGGNFNIPIPTGVTGTYSFQVRAVCDNTSSPRFVSDWMPTITVPVSSGTVNNFYVWAGYGIALQITGGSATGIPASFTGVVVSTSKADYTAAVSAGSIVVTPSGTLGPPTAHLKLVKNSTTVLDSQPLSGLSDITLTVPTGGVSAPDVLSIEIDTP